ncbi:hypothetical protein DAMA08_015940 [Martiniozyma asiatica (nom. inval.)]|nr:hypothetical protein DAMA08_015940 [Martiniozyma asiatica]
MYPIKFTNKSNEILLSPLESDLESPVTSMSIQAIPSSSIKYPARVSSNNSSISDGYKNNSVLLDARTRLDSSVFTTAKSQSLTDNSRKEPVNLAINKLPSLDTMASNYFSREEENQMVTNPIDEFSISSQNTFKQYQFVNDQLVRDTDNIIDRVENNSNYQNQLKLNNDVNSLNNIIKPIIIKKRSNSGCLTCRARRRKCDEHRPICKECARINMKCNYEFNLNLNNWKRITEFETDKSEHTQKASHNERFIEGIGIVKVLRGKVEYKIENGKVMYRA